MLTEVCQTLDPEMKRKHCSGLICYCMPEETRAGVTEGEIEKHTEKWGADTDSRSLCQGVRCLKCYSLLT